MLKYYMLSKSFCKLILAMIVACSIIAGLTTYAQAVDIYSPSSGDFLSIYNSDSKDQSVQSWDNYWGWVQTFYTDHDQNMLFMSRHIQGWSHSEMDLLGNISNATTRDRLTKKLNLVGWKVAAEWSKDNGVRRIDSSDLENWGEQLQQAQAADRGDGATLESMIDQIDNQVNSLTPEMSGYKVPPGSQAKPINRSHRIGFDTSTTSNTNDNEMCLTGTVQSLQTNGFTMIVQTVKIGEVPAVTLSKARTKKIIMSGGGSTGLSPGTKVTVIGVDNGVGTPMIASVVAPSKQ